MENQPDSKKKREGRSPGYPGIDLENALERARQIMDHEQKHFAPISGVCKYWGYSVGSGPALRTTSALLNFGLLDVRGAGNDRELKISESAWRILTDNRVDSPEKTALIREAALKPAVHRKLWEKYQGDFPSDETFIVRLRHEESFTETGANEFIREFQSTLAFAKLEKGGMLSRYDEAKLPREEDSAMVPTRDVRHPDHLSPLPPLPESSETGEQKFEVGLSDGRITYFRAPPSMKAEDWQKIRKLLDVLEPSNAEE